MLPAIVCSRSLVIVRNRSRFEGRKGEEAISGIPPGRKPIFTNSVAHGANADSEHLGSLRPIALCHSECIFQVNSLQLANRSTGSDNGRRSGWRFSTGLKLLIEAGRIQ